nr:hypothetical protein [Prevotella sp. CAG:386]
MTAITSPSQHRASSELSASIKQAPSMSTQHRASSEHSASIGQAACKRFVSMRSHTANLSSAAGVDL